MRESFSSYVSSMHAPVGIEHERMEERRRGFVNEFGVAGAVEAVAGQAVFLKLGEAGLRLGAGTYGLLVQGLVQGSAPAPTSSYTGQLRFDVAAPVPEPAAWALMAVGVVGIGAAARKRRAAGSAAA